VASTGALDPELISSPFAFNKQTSSCPAHVAAAQLMSLMVVAFTLEKPYAEQHNANESIAEAIVISYNMVAPNPGPCSTVDSNQIHKNIQLLKQCMPYET
jgi:hypothetical protein